MQQPKEIFVPVIMIKKMVEDNDSDFEEFIKDKTDNIVKLNKLE